LHAAGVEDAMAYTEAVTEFVGGGATEARKPEDVKSFWGGRRGECGEGIVGYNGGVQRRRFCWHGGGGQVDGRWLGGGVCLLSFSGGPIGLATELFDVGSAVACWPWVRSVNFLSLVEQGVVAGGCYDGNSASTGCEATAKFVVFVLIRVLIDDEKQCIGIVWKDTDAYV